jgi:hypothetical protein
MVFGQYVFFYGRRMTHFISINTFVEVWEIIIRCCSAAVELFGLLGFIGLLGFVGFIGFVGLLGLLGLLLNKLNEPNELNKPR